MTKLSKQTFDATVDLLIPHLETESRRRAFVTNALYEVPQLRNSINFSEDTQTFTRHLVSQADQFGMIDDEHLAVVALLEALRGEVGSDKQQRIDPLIAAVKRESNLANTANHVSDAPEETKRGCAGLLRDNLFQFGVGTTIAVLGLLVAIIALPQWSQAPTVPTAMPTIEIPTAAPTATSATTDNTTAGFPWYRGASLHAQFRAQ